MTLHMFHERMGHLNMADCIATARKQNIKLTNTANFVCDVCELSKQHKRPITDLAVRADVLPGRVLHCDIKGPLETAAYNKCKYALIVVDESTRTMVVKEMVTKDQAVAALKHCIAEFAKLPSKPILVGEGCILHTDSESVLKSRDMAAYLASMRMVGRCSPPHTHERNGIAERAIQTIFNTTRALLHQAGMPDRFWPVAMHHAVFVRNRSPTSTFGGKSAFEQLSSLAVFPTCRCCASSAVRRL